MSWKTAKAPVAITLLIALSVIELRALPWPVTPGIPVHQIGNTYGEYQRYSGSSYLHPGLDILVPYGTPVYAVEAGWVKAVLTIGGDLYWRIAIGETADPGTNDGWLYAHLVEATIPVLPGEYVEQGDYLGDIVEWPVVDFHHIHFVKIRNSGATWESDWEFIANPLDELDADTDNEPPLLWDCYPEYRFAFFTNGTENYFAPGAPISGDVDILARVGDKINHPSWVVSPYSIAYEIYNDTMTTGLIPALTFTDQLFWDQNVNVIFQNDNQFSTHGDYNARIYYHIITNTDGDSVIEISDTSGCWRTTDFDNGAYWVKIYLADREGFTGMNYDTIDSMSVEVYNAPCACPDFCDLDLNGAIDPIDVVLIVNLAYRGLDSRQQIPACSGDNGDWDCDLQVNPVDVVYYVNFVYRNYPVGPCDPCAVE